MQYKECPLKVNGMKLSEAMQVNEIKNEYITLVDTNGNPLKIDKADLIEVIRANMPTVTSQAKGLMPTDGFFSKTPLSKEDNVDELLTTGIYPHGFRIVTSITSSSYGILLVFKTSYNYVVQLDLSLNGTICIRGCHASPSDGSVIWDSQWTRII